MSGETLTTPRQVVSGLEGKSVCPFCGAVAESSNGPCARCTMENTPATRQATRARIGPWYVLQIRNPSAPGMKFNTLLALIKKGQVTPKSILRGPTTHQLWRFAANVRGVSREFGLCHGCGGEIDPTATACPHCQRDQQLPPNPDALIESREPAMVVRATLHRQVSDEPAAAAFGARPPSDSAVSGGNGSVPPAPVGSDWATVGGNGSARVGGNGSTADGDSGSAAYRGNGSTADGDNGSTEYGGNGLMANGANGSKADGDSGSTGTPPIPPKTFSDRPVMRRGMTDEITLDPESNRPIRRSTGEEILTPKELAAVFQLNMPKEATATREPATGHPRRKVLLGLVLLAAVGMGVYAYRTPGAMDNVGNWLQRQYDAAVDRWAKSAVSPASNDPGSVAPAPVTRSPTAPKPDAKARPAMAPTAPAPTPAPAPTAAVPTPAAKKADAPKAEVDSSSSGAVIDPDQAIFEARRLWREGITAEGDGHYAEAVRCYEQIQKLPARAWPSSLQLRLDFARKQLGR